MSQKNIEDEWIPGASFDAPEEYDPDTDESLRFAQGGISLEEYESGEMITEEQYQQPSAETAPLRSFRMLWEEIRRAVEGVTGSELMQMASLSDGGLGHISVSVPDYYRGRVEEALLCVDTGEMPVVIHTMRK